MAREIKLANPEKDPKARPRKIALASNERCANCIAVLEYIRLNQLEDIR